MTGWAWGEARGGRGEGGRRGGRATARCSGLAVRSEFMSSPARIKLFESGICSGSLRRDGARRAGREGVGIRSLPSLSFAAVGSGKKPAPGTACVLTKRGPFPRTEHARPAGGLRARSRGPGEEGPGGPRPDPANSGGEGGGHQPCPARRALSARHQGPRGGASRAALARPDAPEGRCAGRGPAWSRQERARILRARRPRPLPRVPAAPYLADAMRARPAGSAARVLLRCSPRTCGRARASGRLRAPVRVRRPGAAGTAGHARSAGESPSAARGHSTRPAGARTAPGAAIERSVPTLSLGKRERDVPRPSNPARAPGPAEARDAFPWRGPAPPSPRGKAAGAGASSWPDGGGRGGKPWPRKPADGRDG